MMGPTAVKVHWIYQFLLVASAIVLLHGEKENKAASSWYKGCYTLPFNGTVHKQPLRERMRVWSPAKCAMKCANSRYAFAYLTSRTSCFCLGALTRKIHDSFCNLKCGAASLYSCGGSRSASVYSANGPYIAKYEVQAEPLIVEKDEDISVTINIELGHDSSMKSGIPGVESESFDRVEIYILEDPDIRPTRIRRLLHIVDTKGKAQITFHYITEGRKILDVTIMNPISTVYERLYIDVESRMPVKPQLWMESPALFSVCNPRTTDELMTLENRQNTVFIGQSLIIWAKVWSGYNLTFQWNFCGEVERVYEFDKQNPSCQLTLCKENIQEFTFNKTMKCDIEVVVSNSYGSTNSNLTVSAVSPEMKDLQVEALPYKWEWEIQRPLPIPAYDTFIPWTLDIQEGETGERGSEGRRFGVSPVYDVLTPPSTTETPSEPENHIPLQADQYLLEKAINFKANFFMNKIGLSTFMEINFGDGDVLLHNIQPTGYGRKKRQIEEGRHEPLHRTKTPRFLDRINETFPEDSDGANNQDNQDPRSGIETEHGLDCRLEAKFWHIYSDPGVYKVTVRVFDKDKSISGGITQPIHVLNGTAELNMRCPKVAELGKSVIFSLSSVSGHEGKWRWRILQNSSSQWTLDERRVKSTFSLKRSFLRRGFYRVEVASKNGKLSSGCIVLVEEALSGLSVTSKKSIVQTGSRIALHIHLESGSDVTLYIFSEEKPIEAEVHHKENSEWTATFTIDKANCYEFTVRAMNPISSLTSEVVSVCVEESIVGLQLIVPERVNLNKPIPAIVSLSSGSNVSTRISVLTLSGAKLAYLENRIMTSDEEATIKLPPIAKSGVYHVVARAENNVFAKSSSCDVLDYIEVKETIMASSQIPFNQNLLVNRWKLSRVAQNQRNNKMGVYIYVAKLKENRHGALIGDGIMYIWSLKQRSVKNGESVYKITCYYTSSPLFMLSLGKCAPTLDILNSVSETEYIPRLEEHLSNRCDVAVTMKTMTGFHAEFNSAVKDIPRLLIIPQSGVIEVGNSCEFDIKCPMSASGKCLVDFGDGSQPMMITSNSNMKSLSHAFTETGLHRITLSENGWGSVMKQIYTTHVLVQQKIMSLNLQGTSSLSIGINPVGAWHVNSDIGTDMVYKWTIHNVNGSEIEVKFSREEEFAHSFVDVGKYIVKVTVYNDISRQVDQMTVVVEDTYWFFDVKTNTSVLGQPSSFIISTNATNNVVVAKFQNSSEVIHFELSCLPSSANYLDENNVTIHQYIISRTYNETGIFEAAFSLLLQTQEIGYQNLHIVKTEVRHKPEPKYLKIKILNDKAVKIGDKNYVPTNKGIKIESSTNYDPDIFSWKIWKNDSFDDKPLLDIAVSANHGTSKVNYKFEKAGLYKVVAVSHPVKGEGNKATIEIEAEEVITRVWVDKPFSSALGEVVDRCALNEVVRNGSAQYECDSLILSASSLGTQVTFYFYIYFRDDVSGDYSKPTEVIDVVKVTSKSSVTNKASVEYRFNRHGVYSLKVVASNHLGNKSAEIPSEKQTDGTLRPFLFYAQRLIQNIAFKKDYYVVLRQLSTFEVDLGNNTQFLDLEWDMGDGTQLTGKAVQHTYNTKGRKTVAVVASNRVDKKMISTTVSIEIPITSVKLTEMPRTLSSLTKIRLKALVCPRNSAVLYKWYIGNQSITVPYVNYINHKFTGGGIHSVKVIASNNVSSVESQPISIEVQEDIVAHFVGENVVQTNMSTLLEIRFIHGSNISIQWRINDVELQHENYTLNYTFTKVGVYFVHVILANKLGTSSLTRKIFVVDTLCQVPEVAITNNKNHPIMITKSNPIQLEVDVKLNCSYTPRLLYDWKVWKIQFDSVWHREVDGKELYDIADTPANGKVFRIPSRILDYGNYSITVNVTIEDTVLYGDADIRVDVYPSQPVAKIDGGKIQYLLREDQIVLDASVSYDPDFPIGSVNLKYDWECFVLFTPYTPCFEEKYLKGTDLFVPTVAPPTVNPNSNMRSMDTYCLECDASHKRIPLSVSKNQSSITFPGSWLIEDKQRFVFRVKVTANAAGWGPRQSKETVVIKIPTRELEWIQIECKNCGDNKIANQIPIKFQAICASCVNSLDAQDVKVEWSMYEVIDGSSTYYKNETSHCALTSGEGWMSLKGNSGNVSDNNDSSALSLEDLWPVQNSSSFHHYEENSNFIGKTVSEEDLRKPLPMPDLSMDNAPFPADPTHPIPTVTTRQQIMMDLDQVSWQPRLPVNDENDIMVEGTSKNSRHSGEEDNKRKPPPTHSPRPGYFVSPKVGDNLRLDDVADNDLHSKEHYQDYDNTAINLMKISKGGVDNPTLVIHPNSLVGGKTYFVKISVHDTDDDKTLIGKASYYFSILRGPSYGMCSVLYRLNNYAVHCLDWRNQQNDNMNDAVSRYQMPNYDVKYSLQKNGRRRHIYFGMKSDVSFNLPHFDKPAYIHIAVLNANGARTEVCSFLPEGPDTYLNATDDEYLQYAYNKSVGDGSQLNEFISIGDSKGIIALCNIVLDTLPNEDFFEKNNKRIEDGAKVIFSVISALSSVEPQNVLEVEYIVDVVSRALSQLKLVGMKSYLEASKLIVHSTYYIKEMKSAKRVSWQTHALEDEQIMDMFVNAKLLLTEVSQSYLSRFPEANGVGRSSFSFDTERMNRPIESIPLQDIFKREKMTDIALNSFFLGLVESRPAVIGPLSTRANGYQYVAQRLDKIVRYRENDEGTHETSLLLWNVGAVIPEAVEKQLMEKNDGKVYAIVSTMPDISISDFKMKNIDDRHLSLTIYKGDFTDLKPTQLPEPITIALPPRYDKLIEPIHGVISRDHVTANSFTVGHQHNRTLHIEVTVKPTGNRSFPVTIAITNHKKNLESAPAKGDIIRKIVLTRAQLSAQNNFGGFAATKFTMRDHDFIDGHHSYKIVLWNEQASTGRSRRFDDQHIPYTVKIWWSDCYYWNEVMSDWRQDGVKALDESTSLQTLCSTSHLSTFSSSFIPVRFGASETNNQIAIYRTGFFAAFSVLVLFFLVMLFYLRVTHGYKCRESFVEVSRLFQPKFNAVGRRLRWYFGPDQRSSVVPIILHDNKKEHEQVFELLIQTSCWPGSGTTSNVTIRIYGDEGKYEARELITPKTHSARETRFENGFAEDDDCTGINDELFITGALTKFVITFPKSTGNIKKIALWHDHSGEAPDWRVDYVTIRDVTHDQKYHFTCYDWIAIGKGKESHIWEMKPLLEKPSLHQQIAFKLNASLCNFSSICGIIASPGYGNLTRPQRAVHLASLIAIICALSAARFWLEWDTFVNDTELPYISNTNVLYGFVIGIIAAILSLPAQLIFRFSKQDDNISLTIEDATDSIGGSGFLDYYTMHDSFSVNIAKSIENPDHSHGVKEINNRETDVTVLSSTECDCCLDDSYNIPSVKETVCDWLDSKDDSEREEDPIDSNNSIDKGWNLPMDQSLSQCKLKQSTSSIDEEIAKCMMSQSPLKRTHHIVEKDSDNQRNDPFDETQFDEDEQKLPAPIQGSNEIFTVSARLRKELDSMLQSGSLLAEQYAQMEGIYSSFGTNLGIIAPEIVPCEKLEPIPRDFGTLLPKKCRKVAWIYSVSVIVFAVIFALWGSANMSLHDVIPWFETVMFSVVGLVVIFEGSLIFLFAMFKSIYDVAKWKMSSDDFWKLLDDVLCVSHFSTMTKNSTDFYIDSSTYYPLQDYSHFQATDRIADDARVARQIADRERSRYLRHLQPIKISKSLKRKARKTHKLDTILKQWVYTLFVLINGLLLAAMLSHRYDDLVMESSATKSWLAETSNFPTMQSPISIDSFQHRNLSEYVLHNAKTRHDWVNWYSDIICFKEDDSDLQRESLVKPLDLLLKDDAQSRMNFKALHQKNDNDLQYLLVGNAKLTVKLCQGKCYREFLPQQIKTIIDYQKYSPTAAGINEIEAFLKGDSQVLNDTNNIEFESTSNSINFYSDGLLQGKEVMTELLRKDEVFSAKFEAILYNPSSNLYSHISSSVEMLNGEETSMSTEFITNNVRSIMFTFSPNHYSKINYDMFFVCQVCLMGWIAFYAFKCILSIIRRTLINVANEDNKKNRQSNRNVLETMLHILDVLVFILSVTFFILCGRRQTILDSIIPVLYGYDTDIMTTKMIFPFENLIANTTMLSSVCGLLNFFMLLKLVAILKRYHNFPAFIHLSTNWKTAMGEIWLLFLIFWTLVVIISFCTYLAFLGEQDFSSFAKSMMSVILQCLTLGAAPVKVDLKFSMIRAKYGTFITFFFFFVIFVTFRLLLKAFLLAMLRRKQFDTNEKQKELKRKAENAVSVKELLIYHWECLRYAGCCLLSVFPCLNKGTFANQYSDFSSLGFKSNSTSRRERIKLGLTSSEYDRKPSPPADVARKQKKNTDELDKSKFRIPSKALLSEVESQLDEMFDRASALADGDNEEEVADQNLEQSNCKATEMTNPDVFTSSDGHDHETSQDWDSWRKDNAKYIHVGCSLDSSVSVQARRLKRQRRCVESQAKSRPTSSISITRKSSLHYRDKIDSGISCGSRNSTPGFSAFNKKCCLQKENPTDKPPPGNDRLKKLFAAKSVKSSIQDIPTIVLPERRYGWISDDDVLDRSSVVSAISHSSFGTSSTPVPALTALNLEKHNHLSRQASSAARSGRSSGKVVQISDLSSQSSDIVHEDIPTLPETFTQKLWKQLSSIKNYFKAQPQFEASSNKARPLRRSRTTAINIKDIPKVNSKQLKSAATRRDRQPRAKSNASTRKLQTMMNSTRQAFNPNYVRNLKLSQEDDMQYPTRSEHLRFHRNLAFDGPDELEAISIPGAVPPHEISRSSITTTSGGNLRHGGESSNPNIGSSEEMIVDEAIGNGD